MIYRSPDLTYVLLSVQLHIAIQLLYSGLISGSIALSATTLGITGGAAGIALRTT